MSQKNQIKNNKKLVKIFKIKNLKNYFFNYQ